MHAILLLLLLLLQVPAGAGGQSAPADGGVPKASAAATFAPQPVAENAAAAPGRPLLVQKVTVEQLRSLLSAGSYVPVPLEAVEQLRQSFYRPQLPSAVADPPRIREARYRAVLEGMRLTQGTLELELQAPDEERPIEPLLLGKTNLQQLVIRDGADVATTGADRERRLYLLNPGTAPVWQGTWSAQGTVAGDFVTFRLELPPAITSQLVLQTPPAVQLSSSNGLVLGPTADGEQLRWTIYPNTPSRLTLTCRTRRPAVAGTAFSLAGLTAVHTVTGDSMTSRWSLSLPSELQGRNVFITELPATVRIIDVALNDLQPVEWTTSQHEDLQQVRMVLPQGYTPTAITILAVSALPQSDTWTLPLLTPRRWERQGTQVSGEMLQPPSTISLTVPPGTDLDSWSLIGIQERDVIAGPDNSRTFQLVRYAREASAIAHISTSQARIADAVVTLLESSGRLATARCLINVRCEQAAVVELAWPVSRGWEAVAARYASNSRSLFFEFTPAADELQASRLVVHLPESLEPQSSRVLEVQFRQSELPDGSVPQLPLSARTVNNGEASTDALIVTPSAQQSAASGRLWRYRTQLLSQDNFSGRYAWMPASYLPADSLIYVASREEGPVAGAADVAGAQSPATIAYLATVDKDVLFESTRITIPSENLTGSVLELQLLSAAAPAAPLGSLGQDSLTWTVNGQDVTDSVAAPAATESGQERRSLPVSRPADPEAPVVVVCERRRPALVGERLTAAIPFPLNVGGITGQLEIVCPASLAATLEGLAEMSPTVGTPVKEGLQSRVFRLPEQPQAIVLQLDRVQSMRQGEVIDTHVFHLVDEQDRLLTHEVMAFARIGRSGDRVSIPLSLPAGVRPVAFVNGTRVQLIIAEDSVTLPLPVTQEECRVVLIWSEQFRRESLMTASVQLSTVFLPELPFEQSTHHLLVAPDLELISPGVTWAASVPVDTLSLLAADLSAAPAPLLSPLAESADASVMLRTFMTRWQLLSTLNWQHRTLAASYPEVTTIAVQVSSLSVRRTLQYAALIVSLTVSWVLLPVLARFRRPVAVAALLLVIARLSIVSVAVDAVLSGAFWGLCGGFILSMIVRWPRHGAAAVPVRRGVAALLCLVACQNAAQAQPAAASQAVGVRTDQPPAGTAAGVASARPDILLLPDALPGRNLAWVQQSLYSRWQAQRQQQSISSPQVVVTSQQIRIAAESADAVEVILSLGVAVVTGEREQLLTLPLHAARPVACSIDSRSVLPLAGSEPDTIQIPVPASVLIPVRQLQPPAAATESSGAALASPEPQVVAGRMIAAGTAATAEISGTSDATAAVDAEAGPPLTWDIHHIEVRLRPLVTRQANGILFRLPGLPCPVATIQVDSPNAYVRRAFARTGAGVVQWAPADGAVPLSSVPLDGGLEVRLFADAPPPQPASQPSVQFLTLCEKSAGQQLLTTVCQFSQWNPLMHSLQLQVPAGYRLMAVSSADAGELYWSVREGVADIQLNELEASEFQLELRLLCEVPTDPLLQQLHVSRLAQVTGCQRAPVCYVAVRTAPEFSVQPTGTDLPASLPVAEAPPAFASWLRRADVLFQVHSDAELLTLQLTPRTSYSEVRVAQTVECTETLVTWTYEAELETAVLNLFRHSMLIDPAIEITDVQVFAGEANRLDKWYRRGDRLMILLKEGTSGLYRLTVRGRQPLKATETDVRLRCPQLQDVPILESSLTVVDRSESGFVLAESGSAVSDRRLQPSQILPAGVPLRFQIVDETVPLVLRRRRFAPRDAALAVLRQADRATVLLLIEGFPTAADADQMSFAADVVFMEPPRVTLNGQLRNTVRTANEFRWLEVDGAVDEADLVAAWTVPLSTAGSNGDEVQQAVLALPEFPFQLNWKQTLVADVPATGAETATDTAAAEPTTAAAAASVNDPSLTTSAAPAVSGSEVGGESATAAGEPGVARGSCPDWVRDAAGPLEVAGNVAALQFRPLDLNPGDTAAANVLPLDHPHPTADTSGRRRPLVVADTVVLSAPHQSAVAETTLLVFAPQSGTRLTLHVPLQTIVTRIDSGPPVRWDNVHRSRLTVDLIEPVTRVRLRWLSERAAGSMFVTQLKMAPPTPADCVVHHFFTIRSADPGALHLTGDVTLLNRTQFEQRVVRSLQQGLQQLQINQAGLAAAGSDAAALESGLVDGTLVETDPQIQDSRVLELSAGIAVHRAEFFRSTGLSAVSETSDGTVNPAGPWMIYVGSGAVAEATDTAAAAADSSQSGTASSVTGSGTAPRDVFELKVSVGRIPALTTLIPGVAAIMMLCASFARRSTLPAGSPSAVTGGNGAGAAETGRPASSQQQPPGSTGQSDAAVPTRAAVAGGSSVSAPRQGSSVSPPPRHGVDSAAGGASAAAAGAQVSGSSVTGNMAGTTTSDGTPPADGSSHSSTSASGTPLRP